MRVSTTCSEKNEGHTAKKSFRLRIGFTGRVTLSPRPTHNMQRTSSSFWVKCMTDMFSSQGVDVPLLFKTLQLNARQLDDPLAQFDVDTVSDMWRLAVAWSGNATLGLCRELSARHVNFDLVGHAMMSCANLRDGLGNFVNYLALISSAAFVELTPQGEDCWLTLGYVGNTRHLPRQRQEYSLLTIQTLCRLLTRRDVRALAGELCGPEPLDLLPYRTAFDCPLRFNQKANRFLISAADLDAPIPSRCAAMLALHERMIQDQLNQIGSANTAIEVSKKIIQQLHKGEPSREDIASSLALSDRTLQRRLKAENTSFQLLLDTARRELATQYLSDIRYPLVEVTCMLGFSEHSNFSRACKRWFGMAPALYRQNLSVQSVSR